MDTAKERKLFRYIIIGVMFALLILGIIALTRTKEQAKTIVDNQLNQAFKENYLASCTRGNDFRRMTRAGYLDDINTDLKLAASIPPGPVRSQLITAARRRATRLNQSSLALRNCKYEFNYLIKNGKVPPLRPQKPIKIPIVIGSNPSPITDTLPGYQPSPPSGGNSSGNHNGSGTPAPRPGPKTPGGSHTPKPRQPKPHHPKPPVPKPPVPIPPPVVVPPVTVPVTPTSTVPLPVVPPAPSQDVLSIALADLLKLSIKGGNGLSVRAELLGQKINVNVGGSGN